MADACLHVPSSSRAGSWQALRRRRRAGRRAGRCGAGRAVGALPRRLQTAAGPAGAGLRALRGATWAAALTLAALRMRGACFSAADAACLAAQRCARGRRGRACSPQGARVAAVQAPGRAAPACLTLS
jgi:hypothetical protein